MLPALQRKVEFYSYQIEGVDTVFIRIDDPLDQLSKIDRPATPQDQRNYQIEYARYIHTPKPEVVLEQAEAAQIAAAADMRNKDHKIAQQEHRIEFLESSICSLEHSFTTLALHHNSLVHSEMIGRYNAPLYLASFEKFRNEFTELHNILSGKAKR